MKNYKQILEAVNRGIKFALDDYEDQDDIQGQSNSKVNHQHGTKEWLDLMNEVVDLDLPSGTLWCKYNLDVKPNQLSKAVGWYGGYYAWGELKRNKLKYDWNHYKFGQNNSNSEITKYNKNDNLTELLPEDDAAYQFKKCHNFKFHIPTKEQCEELIKYTYNYWVNNYDPNKTEHHRNDGGIKELNGRVFIGKNGNQLFIPAAGYYASGFNNGNIFDVGSCCDLWASRLDLDATDFAYYLSFYSNKIDVDYCNRSFGFSIRPVINL